MKKILIVLIGALFLIGCDQTTTANPSATTTGIESECKDIPLSEGCYLWSPLQTQESGIEEEFLIDETFEEDRLNQIPGKWLLYSNEEYKAGGVSAKVTENGENKYVLMYSDGLQKPPYPQNAPTPTFIFTTKFNLDTARKGNASIDVMVPTENGNSVSVGLSTGAVNTISVTIGADRSVFVKVGGPFYYYSLNNDGGNRYSTDYVVEKDTWYTFRFEWDASQDFVKAYLVENDIDHLLYSGTFHISNRVNAKADGTILVPNVVRVTMPYNMSGYAAIDNVRITRVEE